MEGSLKVAVRGDEDRARELQQFNANQLRQIEETYENSIREFVDPAPVGEPAPLADPDELDDPEQPAPGLFVKARHVLSGVHLGKMVRVERVADNQLEAVRAQITTINVMMFGHGGLNIGRLTDDSVVPLPTTNGHGAAHVPPVPQNPQRLNFRIRLNPYGGNDELLRNTRTRESLGNTPTTTSGRSFYEDQQRARTIVSRANLYSMQ
ncbi:uncharacterized protein LOC129597863 [Paramacrobiotus metropolitanus]|uniref:uncharacterized protein LOC129597863 n=1 Tax=Paramacrobiotus metropolitanus TaxID=2943436 RepID=UPI00244652E0|nr:uncharacterized protein LOC129597863 [Paramacrobiotus metropolitanus]